MRQPEKNRMAMSQRTTRVYPIAVLTWVLLTACQDLNLPPPPGPGSVQGTLVYYRPGRTNAQVAAGARVSIRNSSLSTITNADGYFRLQPVTQTSGSIVFSLDVDGDGRADRQRSMELSTVGSGPGRDVLLGNVTLGLNAVVVGTALRADLGASRTGHAGTSVVVPEAPYATTTADDGTYLLPDLPEGELTVAYVRDGYDVVVQPMSARAGEESTLSPVTLTPLSSVPSPGRIVGRVLNGASEPTSGAHVLAARLGAVIADITTAADGSFSFDGLNAGLYDLAVTQPGHVTIVVRNVVRATGDTDVGDLVLAEGASVPPDFTPLPGLDGGVSDAGAPDSGTPDAGTPDSGTPDAGGVATAVITPSPISVALDAPDDGGLVGFDVHGDLSQGTGPLRFTWDSLTVGLAVDQPSEFSSHVHYYWGAPPAQALTAQIRLVVEGHDGAMSPPAVADVRFAFRPLAELEPAMAVTGGSIVVTSIGSTDPQGLPIVARRFGITGGDAELLPGPSSLDRRVNARSPGLVSVFLEVENSMGVISRRDSARITFLSASDGGVLLVDAGSPQTVDGGATVQLQGSVFSPQGSFSQHWSELTPGTPAIVLSAPSSLNASFVAPVVAGDQLRRFQLEARSPANCSGPGCLVAVSETTVSINDVTGPSGTFSFAQATSVNRFAALDVDFNEPIGASFTVLLRDANTLNQVTVNTLELSPTKLRVFPVVALTDGVTYELIVDVTDTASGQNASTVTGTFIARNTQQLIPLVSSLSSTTPAAPYPSVLLMEPSTLFVAARTLDPSPNMAVLFEPLDLSNPLATLTQSSIIVPTGLKKIPSSKKLQRVGNTVWAGLATPDGSWSPTPSGGGLFRYANGSWTRMNDGSSPTSLPGPMFSDGISLFSAALMTGSTRVARFEPTSSGWPDFVTTATLAEELDATGGGPGQLVAAGDSFEGLRHVCWQRGTTTVLCSVSSAVNTWTSTQVFVATEPLTQLRTAVSDGVPYVGYARKVAGSEVVAVRGKGSSFTLMSVPGLTGATVGFDLVANGRYLWLSVATGGRIYVWRKDVDPTVTSFELVDGFNPDESVNDLNCTGANPELSATSTGVWVVWAERCGVNPWQVAVTKLD